MDFTIVFLSTRPTTVLAGNDFYFHTGCMYVLTYSRLSPKLFKIKRKITLMILSCTCLCLLFSGLQFCLSRYTQLQVSNIRSAEFEQRALDSSWPKQAGSTGVSKSFGKLHNSVGSASATFLRRTLERYARNPGQTLSG